MNDTFFNFQYAKMSDQQFWDQMRELDDIVESLPDFAGFSIKAKLSSGKDITVPFVRFAPALSSAKKM